MLTIADAAHIEVRPDILRWAQDAVRHPVVSSAILFGSRALGLARVDSDWDVALVVKDRREVPSDIADACRRWSPKHGVVVVEEANMREHAATYASLPSEIAAGVVIAGCDFPVEENAMRDKDTAQARNRYEMMAKNFWTAVELELHNLTECSRNGLSETDADLGKHSADAAEFVTKMLCLSLGRPFAHSHRLDKLADELPLEWREEIAALNGATHDLHGASYGDGQIEPADVPRVFAATQNRLLRTLAVAKKLTQLDRVVSEEGRRRIAHRLAESGRGKHLDMALSDAEDELPHLVAAVQESRSAWLSRFRQDANERATRCS